MKYLFLSAVALALVACGNSETPAPESDGADAAVESEAEAPAADMADDMTAEEKLDAVLAAQSDETKARYQYRHPKETLTFFGVEPGMTVVDTLPGEPGWYAPILLSYLGPDGKLYGADYDLTMWPLFTGYATEEFLAARETWTDAYLTEAAALGIENGASVGAFTCGTVPDELDGQVDVVLMIRALHHFNRFEDDGGYFTNALTESYDMLKPGGVLGIVQHRAPEGNSDEWAGGDNGYLKQSQVISFIEGAGFELVDTSEINANPKDQPTEEDFVWRLPPSLGTSRDNPELRAEMEAIGETDRMTLKFRKPE